MWMKGLLKLAPNLIVLELMLVRCPPDLPIMGNLRHLDLHVADMRRSPTLLPLDSSLQRPLPSAAHNLTLSWQQHAAMLRLPGTRCGHTALAARQRQTILALRSMSWAAYPEAHLAHCYATIRCYRALCHYATAQHNTAQLACLAGSKLLCGKHGSCAERLCHLRRGLPRCLRHLSCLRTLGIRRSLACAGELYEGFELPRSLEYLCLNHILPYGLTAPQGCKITILGKACCLDKPEKQ